MIRSLWPFTVRGTLVLICGAGALAVGVALRSQPFIVAGLTLTLLVLACVIALWTRPLVRDAVRTVSATVVAAGTPVQARLRVDVGATRAPRLRWEDTLHRERVRRHGAFEPDESGVARATYTFTPQRRGEHDFGPLWITATDPLGLARRRQPFGAASTLVVGPEIIDLDDADFVDVVGAGGRPVTSYAGDGTDDLVPRPYARGDSRRRVHWKATAHRGELMVRQEEHEAAPTATVLLDRRTADDAALEALLSATVSVASRLSDSGFSVDVLDTDGSTHATRLGADTGDLLSALAHCGRRELVSDTTRAPRAADGPVVVIAGDRAADVARDAGGRAGGHTVLAVLAFASAPAWQALVDADHPAGDLRHGISPAWREAVIRERS